MRDTMRDPMHVTTPEPVRRSVRTWIPVLLVLGGFALSLALFGRLPATVMLDLGRLLPVDPPAAAEGMPRAVAAFGLPTLALLIAALLHDAPTSALGRASARAFGFGDSPVTAADFHKYAGSYRLIVAWIVALVLSFHVAVLAIALSWRVEPGLVVGVVFGAGLLIVGNVMPRLRPNAIAGIRTARTLRDPLLWARVHRTYGALWLACGIAVLVVSWLAPRYALSTGVLALLVSSLAMLAFSRTFTSGPATP